MSSQVTVINRTGADVWVGIDDSAYWANASKINGYLGHGVLLPGQTSGFMVSGSGPYFVGFVTQSSGYNWPAGSNLSGVIVYNVFPSALVTLAAELGTRPTADETES